ncbi:MAG: Glycosyl transferase family 39 [Candidatus Woesebacteria bacterium GW2011_GWB1_40_12]|jgi:hypothetical protein|uniref:Glycosyl transferase family 39 n=1 Tax=Candidatus Woesebacteria bacterium GW2011_GWB1_40_12 TaxID=1618576 RepID=A0A0G0T5V3_9BACT|nr:MAG: Glycosyl transferase family 39 [Candidatus Woesebacteria bacterium GW2011_GWB1_40_12]
MNTGRFERTLKFGVFALVTLLFTYKLDYHYFFTDEILYVQRGIEQFSGIFGDTLQVPPLPKYFAGLLYKIVGNNLGLLRLPYAVMGIISAYIIYRIIKREYNSYYGLIGALLYSTSRIILDATRMVMLEPMLHLFWLLFLYYHYEIFLEVKRKYVYLIAGVFLGLSLSVKLTSLVLLPLVFIGFLLQRRTKRVPISTAIKNYVLMLAAASGVILLTYVHFIYKEGIFIAISDTIKAVKSAYLSKSAEGKRHVIGNNVYEKSPWWTYIFYFIQYNGVIRMLVFVLLTVLAFFRKKLYVLYWGMFLLFILVFHQFSGVKNVRYISSIEIPLVVLSVAGLNFLFQRFGKSKYFLSLAILVGIFLIYRQLSYLRNLQYTEYLGLYRYFKNETSDFTLFKRMYIFGSVRSIRYYRDTAPNGDMILWRRDYELMCPEFDNFDFFAFDSEELAMEPTNTLYKYVKANEEHFERVREIKDMVVYKKLGPFKSVFDCSQVSK